MHILQSALLWVLLVAAAQANLFLLEIPHGGRVGQLPNILARPKGMKDTLL